MLHSNQSNNIDKLKLLVETLTVRDIEIFEAKEMLEIILETSTDGYWDWHIGSGVNGEEDYEYLSPSFKKQLGYDDDEMENRPSSWMSRAYLEDLDRLEIELKKHFESNGEYEFKVITRYTHKNGHLIKILCRGKVIKWDEDGTPKRMVGTHIDITNL